MVSDLEDDNVIVSNVMNAAILKLIKIPGEPGKSSHFKRLGRFSSKTRTSLKTQLLFLRF